MEAILISNSAWYGNETWCKKIIVMFFEKKSPNSTLRKCIFEPNQTLPKIVDLQSVVSSWETPPLTLSVLKVFAYFLTDFLHVAKLISMVPNSPKKRTPRK